VLVRSVFTDIKEYKPTARRMPRPRQEYLDWAKDLLKPNTVGVFARGRKTYGRNLQPEFYVKLVQILEDMGHNVIWLGEKQSTQPCPVDHVLDFSRMPESQDLERTLAIVCNLDFTIQFWTASSRLSSMMGTPFILFESPEQIYVSSSGLCGAQEGKRLELASFGPKKLVMAHYKNVYDDNDTALELVKQAAEELKEGNEEDILGMVEDKWFSGILKAEHEEWLT
jgi:ADP-heptose:LPS heptosyltransferase